MPYLNGKSFNKITSFGKVLEGNFDIKNNGNQWKKHSTLQPPDKLKFGLTHPDKIISQVREKTSRDFTPKMSNLTKNLNKIPSKNGIFTFGKDSKSGNQFPNNGSQFHTQSPQIQNKHGSLWSQYKKDDKL
jgi:hypothetical protein